MKANSWFRDDMFHSQNCEIPNQIAVFPKIHMTCTRRPLALIMANDGLPKECYHGIDIEEHRIAWIVVFVG